MSKNIQNKKLIESIYTMDEAIASLQEYCSSQKKRKFDESVDLAIVLGIDAKQTNQTIKGSVVVPHGLGKKVKIIVLTDDESLQKKALEVGAAEAGFEELINRVEGGYTDFDVCIATPNVMPKISRIAKKLGPRGLMPTPKNGTVTNDIVTAISEALKGKVNYKNDKTGIIHCQIGKISFSTKDLKENIETVLKSIREQKPDSTKGKYIKKLFINSTMGKSCQVEI